MTKKSPRCHSDEFKQETVDLVLKQGYSVADAAVTLPFFNGSFYFTICIFKVHPIFTNYI